MPGRTECFVQHNNGTQQGRNGETHNIMCGTKAEPLVSEIVGRDTAGLILAPLDSH